MQAQIDLLKSLPSNENDFRATGIDGEVKDLIEKIFGRNWIKWMLNVAKHLFSEEELMKSVLEPTNRSKRTHLDISKVHLMRAALKFKYKLDPVKFDKVLAATRQAINNKGRNIKLKFRWKTVVASVGNGIVRSLSSLSVSNNAQA